MSREQGYGRVAHFVSRSLLLVGAHIEGASSVTLTPWGSDTRKHNVATQDSLLTSVSFSVILK